MPIVAVFPLSIARRACKYRGTLTSRAAGSNEPASVTHLVYAENRVYLVNTVSGKRWVGV